MSNHKYFKKVFIESSVFWQLGPRLENVDFANLLEIQKSAGFELFVSVVTWLEYLRERKKELNRYLPSSQNILRILDQHRKSIPEYAIAFERTKAYLEAIDAHYRPRAAELGINILPLPQIETQRLLTMSIECTPPFEEPEEKTKEKGFRDSLIMFTVLDALRNHQKSDALVITNDTRLAEGLQLHAREYNAAFHVAQTIDEAAKIVSETITKAERLRLQSEMQAAIDMLMKHRSEIEAKVMEIKELTDADLGQRDAFHAFYGMTERSNTIDIKTVKSVAFDQVNSAAWKETNGETCRILFDCLCKANVIVRVPYVSPFWAQPKRYKIGEVPTPDLYNTILSLGQSDRMEEKTLPFLLYGQASFRRDNNEWQLVSLRLDKSPPWDDEFAALTKASDSAYGTDQSDGS
ncbi:MAG TPA: PIN domain-containing protein [Candidatus Acidoferrales bacterium]|nr:PIN domain-containing protein [Candidatus Acidoferrales bacterium]